MNKYEKHANDFLKKTETRLEVKFLKHGKHFEDDKDTRDIYQIRLSNKDHSYVFNFGQSLHNSGFKIITGAGREHVVNIPEKDREKAIKQPRLYANMFSKFALIDSDKVKTPKEPTAYDILACLTKYSPGTFEGFCSEFGYDTDSKKSEKIYNAVKDEYLNVRSLFDKEQIEELQEIN